MGSLPLVLLLTCLTTSSVDASFGSAKVAEHFDNDIRFLGSAKRSYALRVSKKQGKPLGIDCNTVVTTLEKFTLCQS